MILKKGVYFKSTHAKLGLVLHLSCLFKSLKSVEIANWELCLSTKMYHFREKRKWTQHKNEYSKERKKM